MSSSSVEHHQAPPAMQLVRSSVAMSHEPVYVLGPATSERPSRQALRFVQTGLCSAAQQRQLSARKTA